MASIWRNESDHYLHLLIACGTNVNNYYIMLHKHEQMSSLSSNLNKGQFWKLNGAFRNATELKKIFSEC